jgi:hypothetical protein
MEDSEALAIARRCAPHFEATGLDTAPNVTAACAKSVATLWGGMGAVYELCANSRNARVTFIVKVVRMPKGRLSVGDERKRKSYEVESRFYADGHAVKLIAAGCNVPRPLLVERSEDGTNVIIAMTKLSGRSDDSDLDRARAETALTFLAKLHSVYWGRERAGAAVAAGLQSQGAYWFLDTRRDEWERMPTKGWEGRLRLAARALDERLKADPMQTIVHGDAKEANMVFDVAGAVGFCDFQYVGMAPPSKDLAYCLCCASSTPAAEAALLKHYHNELSTRLAAQGDASPSLDALATSTSLAYCDLGRWMSGWGWWGHDLRGKILPVLDRLDGGKALPSDEAYVVAMRREFPV